MSVYIAKLFAFMACYHAKNAGSCGKSLMRFKITETIACFSLEGILIYLV